MKYTDEFRNPKAIAGIIEKIRQLASSPKGRARFFRIMEVCGTHSMAIAKFAINDLLPRNIELISGPGCPVCVSDAGYIDAALELARGGALIATFGDMVNVPGSETTLAKTRAEGITLKICYSPLTALDIARANPDKQVVFLAVGFETTIAPFAVLLDIVVNEKIENFSFLTSFKLILPAMEALTSDTELNIDAFLCPANVSVIIGAKAYEPFVSKYKIPCVIAGFEPVDILMGIEAIVRQLRDGRAEVENMYRRAAKYNGNIKARELMKKYFEVYDASWRGIGIIPKSGMKIRKNFEKYDALAKFGLEIKKGKSDLRCRCGDVLKGKIKPSECPLFSKICTPVNPVGPCMVSSEGSCAAYFKYMNHG